MLIKLTLKKIKNETNKITKTSTNITIKIENGKIMKILK